MEGREIVKMIESADQIIKVLRDQIGEEGIDSSLGDFDKFFKLADILPTVLGRSCTQKEISTILDGGTLHV